jgi:hypothetical protein
VAAEAPAHLPARIPHPRRSDRDFVDRADLERCVVKAGSLRGQEREVVVVGRAAHEGDEALDPVGQLEAEHPRVEADLAIDVRGEQENVAELPGRGPDAPVWAPAHHLTLDVTGAVH